VFIVLNFPKDPKFALGPSQGELNAELLRLKAEVERGQKRAVVRTSYIVVYQRN
jgi:hypothetical protein